MSVYRPSEFALFRKLSGSLLLLLFITLLPSRRDIGQYKWAFLGFLFGLIVLIEVVLKRRVLKIDVNSEQQRITIDYRRFFRRRELLFPIANTEVLFSKVAQGRSLKKEVLQLQHPDCSFSLDVDTDGWSKATLQDLLNEINLCRENQIPGRDSSAS